MWPVPGLLGFGGHLRVGRGPAQPDDETTVVIASLTYAGTGWHTPGDALLANTSAAMARERQLTGRIEMTSQS